ncbi:MAG: 16S rRNA processing protein RimM [Rikenellaceae bacterium]|jgi:16S rRNA processing protein RimM|nr:16S rRNA processing protein RimM [Rikenellaceae bacterium]
MTSKLTSKKSPVGRISKPFGAAGGLVVNLYDGFPAVAGPDSPVPAAGKSAAGRVPVWVVVDSLEVPLYLDSFERRGRTSAVVEFADIDTPRRAQELVGKELLLPAQAAREEEKDDDQLYMEDLVGYTAHLGGELKAVIEDFYESEFNPLFQFTIGGAEVLIPAAEDFITKVNERRREVWFSLPEGLIDVNE